MHFGFRISDEGCVMPGMQGAPGCDEETSLAGRAVTSEKSSDE
jgi:hypothetical protein